MCFFMFRYIVQVIMVPLRNMRYHSGIHISGGMRGKNTVYFFWIALLPK